MARARKKRRTPGRSRPAATTGGTAANQVALGDGSASTVKNGSDAGPGRLLERAPRPVFFHLASGHHRALPAIQPELVVVPMGPVTGALSGVAGQIDWRGAGWLARAARLGRWSGARGARWLLPAPAALWPHRPPVVVVSTAEATGPDFSSGFRALAEGFGKKRVALAVPFGADADASVIGSWVDGLARALADADWPRLWVLALPPAGGGLESLARNLGMACHEATRDR